MRDSQVLAYAAVELPPRRWHDLKVVRQEDLLRVYRRAWEDTTDQDDGWRLILEAKDEVYPDLGRMGWGTRGYLDLEVEEVGAWPLEYIAEYWRQRRPV